MEAVGLMRYCRLTSQERIGTIRMTKANILMAYAVPLSSMIPTRPTNIATTKRSYSASLTGIMIRCRL